MGYITLAISVCQTGEESKGLHEPCCLGIPRAGRIKKAACVSGSKRNQMGNITPTVLGSPQWGMRKKKLQQPLPSRGPQ